MKKAPENEKLPYPGETISLFFIVISLSAASSSRPRESGGTPGGTEGPNIGPFTSPVQGPGAPIIKPGVSVT